MNYNQLETLKSKLAYKLLFLASMLNYIYCAITGFIRYTPLGSSYTTSIYGLISSFFFFNFVFISSTSWKEDTFWRFSSIFFMTVINICLILLLADAF